MSNDDDRREEPRYPANADTECAYVLRVTADIDNPRIKNLSMTGIGLVITQQVSRGTILTVGLSNKSREMLKTVLVEVIHATPQMNGEFLVGGTLLTPLSYEEWSAFVL